MKKFVVTFVKDKKGEGVIASEKVQGRYAFPDRYSRMTTPGTYRVFISGENPKRTVYFLDVIEPVSEEYTGAVDEDLIIPNPTPNGV